MHVLSQEEGSDMQKRYARYRTPVPTVTAAASSTKSMIPSRDSTSFLFSSMHSISIRTISSYHLLSALLNWFKLVYGPLKQSHLEHELYIHLISSETSQEWMESTKVTEIGFLSFFNRGDTIQYFSSVRSRELGQAPMLLVFLFS